MSARQKKSEKLEWDPKNPHIQTYGEEATKLVFERYSAIVDAFRGACERGIFEKNEVLSHKLHSTSWDAPPLLSNVQLTKFRVLTHLSGTEVLEALWYILDHVCDERVLAPVLRLDRETHEECVELMR